MEFRILGRIEVTDDGILLDLGPLKQRSLLALLVINANRTVTTDRILEELWGIDAEGKENALWVYVSRLRSVLEKERSEPAVLLTRDHGYSLTVEPMSVDASRFEAEVAQGRSLIKDDPAAASEQLEAALSLWRGDALEDFRYDDFAQAEINRLDELRVATFEARIEADLRQGRSGELIGELDALSSAHPLRERPICLKMLALYRAGRQADALRAYEQFRLLLGEELGIEPSPELHRMEEQILLHDSRLQAPRGRRTAASPSPSMVNPFKGLRAFREGDAEDFFGRDRLVADVVRRLDDGLPLVALVGASGSGKSSVVQAGVVPALRKNAIEGSDSWLVAQMVPGSRPFAELEAALLRAAFDPPDSLSALREGERLGILRAALRVLPEPASRLLLVIDQFEELFTLVKDETTRQQFLDALVEALSDPHSRVTVLLTLRADFYDRPLQHAPIGTMIGAGVVNVVPMTPDELEQAVNEPAARAGITVEPALMAEMLSDVIGRPGVLPQFQYTLTALFDRRVDHKLKAEAYRAMGGLAGALTRRAVELFAGLSKGEQQAARQLFLRLVSISNGDEWSRRRVPAEELIALDLDIVELQAVIDAYGDARLLTFDRDPVAGAPTVEVAHEALLTEWERLRKWIDAARSDIQRQLRLATAADEWRSSADDPDYLLAGSRLAEFELWAQQTTLALTDAERTFLTTSVEHRGEGSAAERRRNEQEQALRRRAKNRLWGLATMAVTAVVLVFGALQVPSASPSPGEEQSQLAPGSALERWVSRVQAMVDAANRGRLDDYRALFTNDAVILGESIDLGVEEALFAAGVRWEFISEPFESCALGASIAPCALDSPPRSVSRR